MIRAHDSCRAQVALWDRAHGVLVALSFSGLCCCPPALLSDGRWEPRTRKHLGEATQLSKELSKSWPMEGSSLKDPGAIWES